MYVCVCVCCEPVMCVPSQFVCVESLATSITDMFPNVLRRSGRREILVLVIAVVCFLLGLPLITEVGEREWWKRDI